MKKAKVINCHQLSIRRNVTVPEEYSDIIATIPAGKTVIIDDSTVYYSWNDRKYYKVKYGMNSEEGFAAIECLGAV